MSELTRRVLFSVVAIPVALGAIWYGDWALAALLAIAAALGAGEFFRIAREAGHQPFVLAGAALAGLLPIVVHGERLGVFRGDLPTLALVAALAIFAASIWTRWPEGRPI
ncbi:MAG: phosphatidate cytidylyltransferase, partial [Gemmatimonadaceae bacterium]|nr:phosphatidate cytidylyltransferase [Gemmatimonadaceae bacterium]